jgi:hypothetical protein
MAPLPCPGVPGAPVRRADQSSAARAPLAADGGASGMAPVTLVAAARVKAAAPRTPDRVARQAASMADSAVDLVASDGSAERRGARCKDAETKRRERSEEKDSDRHQLPFVGAVASRGPHARRVSPTGRTAKSLTPGEVAICPDHSPDGPLSRHGPSWAGRSRRGSGSSHGSVLTNGHRSPFVDLAGDVRSRSGSLPRPPPGRDPQSSVCVPLASAQGSAGAPPSRRRRRATPDSPRKGSAASPGRPRSRG